MLDHQPKKGIQVHASVTRERNSFSGTDGLLLITDNEDRYFDTTYTISAATIDSINTLLIREVNQMNTELHGNVDLMDLQKQMD